MPPTDPVTVPYTSKLGSARERFLASVVDHAHAVGRRSAADFLRAFPPRAILRALASQPQLRARILVATTGQNEKVAEKKSAESAGEDVEIALAEGVTTDEALLALLDPDERVRFLDPARLWAFVTEGEFWRITSSDTPASIAREHVAFILERARAEKLLTSRDIVEGVGVDMLAEALPKEELVRLLGAALAAGRAGKPFDDDRALAELPAAKLVEHVSLAHLWSRVVARHVSFEPKTDDEERVSIELVMDDRATPEPSPAEPHVDVEGMLSELRGPKKARDSVSDRVTVTPDLPGKLAPPRSGSG